MKQSRVISFIEASLNTQLGFLVSFLIWPIAAWATGIEYTTQQHWAVVAIFTLSSVIRGYAIRRFFNNGMHLVALKIARKLVRKQEQNL